MGGGGVAEEEEEQERERWFGRGAVRAEEFLGCTQTRACRRCNTISSGTAGCVTRYFFIPAAGAACVLGFWTF